jgi:hypothetical protein
VSSISVGTNSFLVSDAAVNVCVCVYVYVLVSGQVALLSWPTECGIQSPQRINFDCNGMKKSFFLGCRCLTTNLRCVATQKNEYIFCFLVLPSVLL